MSFATGSKIGPYEILAPIGAGGMGEVYRARDTRLKREIALKVLPEAFAADPARMLRFEREAEVLASLNHPNIAQIYGVEERALVMELVEGESPKGPMPFEEAWKIAMQIADALEYAHEKGVIHRDLKPANVKVTPDGVVKLLDFGLAKAFSPERDSAASGSVENSPTLTIGVTEVGVILGTAAYMAPEQAKGKRVDKRADIWSWGVMLYELMTGDRLFQGDDAADTLAQVLTSEPDLKRVPPQVRRLLGRCLEKDPKKRLRDIGDCAALFDLPMAAETSPKWAWLSLGLAAGFFVLAAGLGFIHFRETPAAAPMVRTTMLPPDNTRFDPVSVAVSPDARRIAFSAIGTDGKRQLWVRRLDSLTAQPLAGTEGASRPFWSPDGQSIGFFAGNKLNRIDAGGGPVLALADASDPTARGGAWSPQGVIVFGPTNTVGLLKVSALGGPVTEATKLAPGEASHRWPHFLADGRHFLFAAGRPGINRIALRVGSLDSTASTKLLDADSGALFSSDHLLFVRGETLMAQSFDSRRLALEGEAAPVIEHVLVGSGADGAFTASGNGLLAYTIGTANYDLTWLDRDGKRTGGLGDPGEFGPMCLSPDDKKLALEIADPAAGSFDLWIYDLERGIRTRLTADPAQDRDPVWSPDGHSIVFASNRSGHFDIYRKSADGSGTEELLYADDSEKTPTSISPDGKFLLFSESRAGREQLWVLPDPLGTGRTKPRQLIETPFDQSDAEFSPDGKWIVYDSDETGRLEVFAAAFPGLGAKRQVSQSGGRWPRWRAGGSEVLFRTDNTGDFMAVQFNVRHGDLQMGEPRRLFAVENSGPGTIDISTDGQRIISQRARVRAGEPLTIIQNWAAGLKR